MEFKNAWGSISITSDMFSYSIKPDLEETLRMFAHHGLKHLHWGNDWNSEILYSKNVIEHYRQLIESYGLKCIDVHGTSTLIIKLDALDDCDLNKYIQLLRNRIEFCSAVGGDIVVIHPPNIEGINFKGARQIMEKSTKVFKA